MYPEYRSKARLLDAKGPLSVVVANLFATIDTAPDRIREWP